MCSTCRALSSRPFAMIQINCDVTMNNDIFLHDLQLRLFGDDCMQMKININIKSTVV